MFGNDAIDGESYFSLIQSAWHDPNDLKFNVLRLVNTPVGSLPVPDERGIYVACPKDNNNDVVMFKVTSEDSKKPSSPDDYRFAELAPEESLAVAEEIALAADVYKAQGIVS